MSTSKTCDTTMSSVLGVLLSCLYLDSSDHLRENCCKLMIPEHDTEAMTQPFCELCLAKSPSIAHASFDAGSGALTAGKSRSKGPHFQYSGLQVQEKICESFEIPTSPFRMAMKEIEDP